MTTEQPGTATASPDEPTEPGEQESGGWWRTTGPFTDDSGRRPARLKLAQVDDDTFELKEPFRYVAPDGRQIRVAHEWMGLTDLASIPSLLGWFARRHGRHTFAVLVHDQLVCSNRADLPEDQRMHRRAADRILRDALRASEVPVVKSWVLWTGVSVPTQWIRHPNDRYWLLRRAAFVLWCLVAVAGTIALGWALATWKPALALAALLAPLPAALLWWPVWPAGLVAGYAVWPVALGTIPVWVAYQAYRGVEYLALLIRKLLPGERPLPKPADFDKR